MEAGDLQGLTERQRQVAVLIVAGFSNDEVGALLGISPRTARAHSDAVRFKLGVLRRRHISRAYLAANGGDLHRVLETVRAEQVQP